MIWGTQWDAMVNFIGDHTATAPGSEYLTGASEYNDKSKNVYDTSTGTVYEWTATAQGIFHRVGRGGYYIGAYASSRCNAFNAYYAYSLFGTRTQLYIKDGNTIRYDANGGELGEVPYAENKEKDVAYTITDKIPTREGYTFLGWNTDKDATEATYVAGNTYVANADMTLYAVWEKPSYTDTLQDWRSREQKVLRDSSD